MSFAKPQTEPVSSIENNQQLKHKLQTEFGNTCESEKIESIASNLGLKQIGEGCYRKAYSFTEDCELPIHNPKDYIIKIETGATTLANEAEQRVFEELPRIAEEYCAPILLSANNNRWIIMPYLDTESIVSDDVWSMADEIEDRGYTYSDIAQRNVGYDGDNLKLVDFGHRWKTTDGELIIDV